MELFIIWLDYLEFNKVRSFVLSFCTFHFLIIADINKQAALYVNLKLRLFEKLMNHEKNGERGGNLNREKSFQLNHISSDVWDVLLSHYIIWTKTNGSHNSRNSKCDVQLPGNPIFVKILFFAVIAESIFAPREKKERKILHKSWLIIELALN